MIKELSKTLGKNGLKYQLLANTSSKALYEVRSGGQVVAYEIGYRKFRVPNPRFEKETAYRKVESFWGNEDFGKLAWTYPSLEVAKKYYEELECKSSN